MTDNVQRGMTAVQAARLERGIIGGCLLMMAFVFQPFSQALFAIGCAGVVVGGLAFNLVPFCRPRNTYRQVGRAALVVAVIFLVVVALALASAWAYGIYLRAQ